MNNLTIKAIIFDMDGVLVDSEPHHVSIEKKHFSKLGLEISDEEHSTYMGKATDIMWKEIIHNKNLSYNSKDLVEQTVNESITHFSSQEDLVSMPGLIRVLDKIKCKGIPMAVASSSGQAVIDILLDKIGVKKYFQYTVSSELVGGSKPDPGIFLYAANLLEVKPEECIVIEDSSNGVRAAKAANMYCVAYNGASIGNQNQSLADVQINHYSELEKIVENLIN